MLLLESQCNTYWFPWLEENAAFFESIFSMLTLILGGITIIIGINHIKSKQFEAKFGFYINMIAYIERYKYFINHYSRITELLFPSKIRIKVFGTEMPKERAEIVAPKFAALCNEFLGFLSNASNNVPPVKKKDKKEWNLWYQNILTITKFLQKCVFIGSDLSPYIDENQIEEYKKELKSVNNAIKKIESQISSKIGYNLNKS